MKNQRNLMWHPGRRRPPTRSKAICLNLSLSLLSGARIKMIGQKPRVGEIVRRVTVHPESR